MRLRHARANTKAGLSSAPARVPQLATTQAPCIQPTEDGVGGARANLASLFVAML